MASLTTNTWGNSNSPRLRLDYSTSQSETGVTVSWTLYYVTTTYGGAAYTNGNARAWSVTIGGNVTYGSYNINGVTSTSGIQIGSGSTTINRPSSTSDTSATIKIVFDVDVTWGSTYASSVSGSTSITIPHRAYCTIAYNANGGSGAPSSQTKYYGVNLTLSSTVPTRSGYTFAGWATSSTATSATYAKGATYTANPSSSGTTVTLYAVWTENTLTVNYYTNKATSGTFKGTALSGLSASSNVIISNASSVFKYATTTSAGLADMQNDDYIYLTKKGYTAAKSWNTKADGSGVSISQSTSYSGKTLAAAAGISIDSGNATLNVYAEWKVNSLSVNYYSNYASTLESQVDNNYFVADSQQNLITRYYYYDVAVSEGLLDYSSSGDELYMTRKKYKPSGFWGTKTEVSKNIRLQDYNTSSYFVDTDTSTYIIGEDYASITGEQLAKALGNTLEEKSLEVDLYPLWILQGSTVIVYDNSGNKQEGLLHIKDDSGTDYYGIVTIYDENGIGHESY